MCEKVRKQKLEMEKANKAHHIQMIDDVRFFVTTRMT